MMNWKLPACDTYFAPILAHTPEGFELPHLDFALDHVKQFRVAVDGGAHVGTWTKAMSKRFGRVLAFEPAIDSYECLVANLQDCTNVLLMRAALGAQNGEGILTSDPKRPGNTGARVIVASGKGSIRIDMLDVYELHVLDFLKLDVEGYEIEALRGARYTIAHCKPTILIECKVFNPPRYGGPQVAISFLKELGYKQVGGIGNDQVFVCT